mmetsp:Transcript_38294/g.56402  ORF Transcript_38294/g.56402 Transcript_38294/m.56402 type:complete len:207 (+) Transcript_38294:112-732(+)
MNEAWSVRAWSNFSAGNRRPSPPSSQAFLNSDIIVVKSLYNGALIRPLSTDNCSSISNTGNVGSVTASYKSVMACSRDSSVSMYPAIPCPIRSNPLLNKICAPGLLLVRANSPPQPSTSNTPSKISAVATLSGFSSSNDAMRFPGANAAPSLEFHDNIPLSSTFSGMNIFITSISAYACPFETCAPSSTSFFTSFPATSVRRLAGS